MVRCAVCFISCKFLNVTDCPSPLWYSLSNGLPVKQKDPFQALPEVSAYFQAALGASFALFKDMWKFY